MEIGKTKILFVDDDPMVLKGLRRMLLEMQKEWDIQFAHSGEEALGHLSKHRFDVIVSDMRMPGMAGAELLDRVKDLYPDMVRILLTAHTDDAVMIKATKYTHQCIAKPCDTEILKSVISRTLAHRSLLTQEKLRQLVSRLDSLPSLPAVYSRITKATEDPECSVQQVGKIIEEDVGISVKIIQLINSAFYGVAHRVSRPSEAAVFLGMDMIKAIVLGLGVFSGFDKSKVSEREVERIYQHSLKTGTIAQTIAKTEGMQKAVIEEVFVSGLLHDIGKLVIAHNLPESYKQASALSAEKQIPFAEAETEILGADHALIGAYLLGLWGLPETLVQAVAYHHRPRSAHGTQFGAPGIIHVADALEHLPAKSQKEGAPVPGIDITYLTELGLFNRLTEWKNLIWRNQA